jgi:uncharacterized membrane protein YcfT
MANIHTGSYLVDQFAAYFVYFYSGYIFAPLIFRLIDYLLERRLLAVLLLACYVPANIMLVFSPGYAVLPNEIHPGLAALPGIRLALALSGSFALCVTAALITGSKLTEWLGWLGERSIVVYLVFVLPMSFARIAFGKFIHDATLLSGLVIVFSIAASVALYLLVQWTGRGKFLFERPAWAHLPGTRGSRNYKVRAVPAE